MQPTAAQTLCQVNERFPGGVGYATAPGAGGFVTVLTLPDGRSFTSPQGAPSKREAEQLAARAAIEAVDGARAERKMAQAVGRLGVSRIVAAAARAARSKCRADAAGPHRRRAAVCSAVSPPPGGTRPYTGSAMRRATGPRNLVDDEERWVPEGAPRRR